MMARLKLKDRLAPDGEVWLCTNCRCTSPLLSGHGKGPLAPRGPINGACHQTRSGKWSVRCRRIAVFTNSLVRNQDDYVTRYEQRLVATCVAAAPAITAPAVFPRPEASPASGGGSPALRNPK